MTDSDSSFDYEDAYADYTEGEPITWEEYRELRAIGNDVLVWVDERTESAKQLGAFLEPRSGMNMILVSGQRDDVRQHFVDNVVDAVLSERDEDAFACRCALHEFAEKQLDACLFVIEVDEEPIIPPLGVLAEALFRHLDAKVVFIGPDAGIETLRRTFAAGGLSCATIRLKPINAEVVYRDFYVNLNSELRAQVDETTKNEFVEFIEFHADIAPYCDMSSKEIGEKLAAFCNSNGRILFPSPRTAYLPGKLIFDKGQPRAEAVYGEIFERAIMIKRAQNAGRIVPPRNLSVLIQGAPGTGKTTYAESVAEMLVACGLADPGRIVCVDALDLLAAGVGKTRDRTRHYTRNALGGVLIVENVTALVSGGRETLGEEVVSELVSMMDVHDDAFALILIASSSAGRTLKQLHPDLAARIGWSMVLNVSDPGMLTRATLEYLHREGLAFGDQKTDSSVNMRQLVSSLMKLYDYFGRNPEYGSWHFARRVAREIASNHFSRTNSFIGTVQVEDIPSVWHICDLMEIRAVSNEESIRETACHEMGHIACIIATSNDGELFSVSVEPRADGSLGVARHSSSIRTKEDYLNDIAVCFGGMAAEQHFMGTTTHGVASDLARATATARKCVALYGMGGETLASYADAKCPLHELPEEIRGQVERLVQEGYEMARAIVEKNAGRIERVVPALIEKRHMTASQIREIWDEDGEAR